MTGAQGNESIRYSSQTPAVPSQPPPPVRRPSAPQPLPARRASVVPNGAVTPPAARQRPLHLSAWTDLLLTLPWVAWSYLAIIFVAGFFVDLTDGPAFWVLMGVWFGSGVATLHPQSETLIARYVYRLRDLNQLEYQQIGPAWHTVCAAAGVSPNVFRVWIYDGQQITAPAPPGTRSQSRHGGLVDAAWFRQAECGEGLLDVRGQLGALAEGPGGAGEGAQMQALEFVA